jgi:hypothetical protein
MGEFGGTRPRGDTSLSLERIYSHQPSTPFVHMDASF